MRSRSWGGAPETGGSLLAAAQRTFLDLETALTVQDDSAIIAEVERSEGHIRAKYEAALADEDLAPSTTAVILKAYSSVQEGHDRMSALKHVLA